MILKYETFSFHRFLVGALGFFLTGIAFAQPPLHNHAHCFLCEFGSGLQATPWQNPPQLQAVPGALLAPAKPGAAKDLVLDLLRENRADLGLQLADLNDVVVKGESVSKQSGLRHLYLRQRVHGLEVECSNLSAHLKADGAVVKIGNRFSGDLAAKVNAPQPTLSAVEAVVSAATHVQAELRAQDLKHIDVPKPDAKDQWQLFESAGVSQDPIPARLVYCADRSNPNPSLRLAWNVVLNLPDGHHWMDLYVDASDGRILNQFNWVTHMAQYQVFPEPLANPDEGSRSLIVSPEDPVASPFGWHDTDGVAGAEFTDTRGNNVFAQEDQDANNSGGNRVDGTAALDFQPGLDLSLPATSNIDAAIVNLFYWNNLLHDVHYHYGFDEASGNFQMNNYGNGGLGNDPVQADALDGSGSNNANMSTPPDGQSPRMQMFEWTSATPTRDSDFDNLIIVHEYGHGVSIRLTGGPANSNCLRGNQSGGMGEGWSDWWGLVMTTKPTDTRNDDKTVGTYVLGQPLNGAGIRPHPYSTDMTTNPHTYASINSGVSVPHGVGSVWCVILWEVYWNLVDAHGFDPNLHTGTGGNNIAMQLIMEGLKLQPCDPTFVDARDAILAADLAIYNGANQQILWTAFAKRGLGFNADDGTDHNDLNVTDSFVVPNFNMRVLTVDPDKLDVDFTPRTQFTITYSDPVDPTTVMAADLLVNGVPANSFTILSSNEVEYLYASTPVTMQGTQTMFMASNAVVRLSDGGALEEWESCFLYDQTAIAVTTMTPPPGSVVTLPLTTLTFDFNEPFAPGSLNPGDLDLGQGSATAVNVVDADTATFTIAGVVDEGTLTVEIPAGTFTDLFGNPNVAFTATLIIDNGTVPFGIPFVEQVPAGAMIYASETERIAFVNPISDSDQFTVDLDPGQILAAQVQPGNGLLPTVEIFAPGGASLGTRTAASPGQILALTVPALAGGTYTVEVRGAGTADQYRLRLFLNTLLEVEPVTGVNNNSAAAAEPLDPVVIPVLAPVERSAARGSLDASDSQDWYAITLSVGDSLTLVLDEVAGSGFTLQLFDPSGAILEANGVSADEVSQVIRNYKVLTAGAYRIRVAGSGTYDLLALENADFDVEFNHDPASPQMLNGPMRVLGSVASLAGLAPLPGELEPNDDGVPGGSIDDIPLANQFDGNFNQTGASTYFGSVTGVVATGTDADWDFFAFSASPGDSVVIDLLGQPSAAGTLPDPYLRLYDSNGNQITANDDGGNGLESRISYNSFPVPGLYYAVADSFGTQFGSYRLDIALTSAQPRTSSGDDYLVPALAGDTLTIQSMTPMDGPDEFENNLDPAASVLTAAGGLLAADDNSAADGRNVQFGLTAPANDVVVSMVATGATAGTYLLEIMGVSGNVQPLITDVLPTNTALLSASPTLIIVTLDSAVRVQTVDASDLTVNGVPATSVTINNGNELRFTIPSLGQGGHTASIAPGSFLDVSCNPFNGTNWMFTVDHVPPVVTGTTVQNGDVLPAGSVSITISFSEPLSTGTLDVSDLQLVGSNTGVVPAPTFVVAADGMSITMTWPSLPEDGYTLTLTSGNGAFEDVVGNDLDGEATLFPLPPNQSGNGTAGGDFVLQFNTDVQSTTINGQFVRIVPEGGHLYRFDNAALIAPVTDTDNWVFDVDAGNTITVVIRPDPAASVGATLSGPLGFTSVTASSPSSGQSAIVQQALANVGGTFEVEVAGVGASTAYEILIFLNAAAEEEREGRVPNDSPASAQSLDAGLRPMLGNAFCNGAVGELPPPAGFPLFTEDFESLLGPSWTVSSSTANGRILLGNPVPPGRGSQSLFMDTLGGDTLNEATLQLNLAGQPQVDLSFIHAEWGDETHDFTGPFTNSFDADGVALSVDGVTWYPLLNLPDQNTGEWLAYTVDLTAFAAANGLTLSATTFIRFQQFDNFDLPTDGRGFDDIFVTRPAPMNGDWYAVNLAAGQWLEAAVVSTEDEFVTLDVLGPGGVPIATGVPSANWDSLVTSIVANATGPHYLRVDGSGEYDLWTIKEGHLDIEPNNTQADAQPIGPRHTVKGFRGDTILASGSIAEIEPNDDGVAGGGSGDLPFAQPVDGAFGVDPGGSGLLLATVMGTISSGSDLDHDFFAMNLNAGDSIEVDMFGSPSGRGSLSDTYLRLYDSAGVQVAFDDDGGLSVESRLLFGPVATPGVFYIAADSFGSATGTYEMEIRRTPFPLDGADWFSITLPAGSPLSVTTITPSDGPYEFVNLLDPRVTVYDPAGGIIGSNDHSAVDGRNVFWQTPSVAAAGTYFVQLQNATGTEGEYVLHIDDQLMHTLTVVSPFSQVGQTGQANPAVGTQVYPAGTTLSPSVTSGIPFGVGTQLFARAWTGTGSVPAAGMGATVPPFALNTNSVITWLWETQVLYTVSTLSNGSVFESASSATPTTGGWVPLGANVTLTAVPAPLHHFVGWTGDVPQGAANNNPLVLPATQARNVTAVFAPDVADVVVTKTAPPTAISGSTFTYTMVVSNAGPDTASGVVITDPLPPALSSQVITANFGTLAAGASTTLQVNVTSAAGFIGTVTNTATITSASMDPVSGNDSGSAITVISRSADLSISLSAPAYALAGGTANVTLMVLNAGPNAATSIVVNNNTSNPMIGPASFTVPNLAPGASTTLPFTLVVPASASGLWNLSYTVSHADNDPVTPNNTATATIAILEQSDVGIVKTGPAFAVPGATVSYNLLVTNSGPSDASVAVNDLLPATLTPLTPIAFTVPLAAGASTNLTVTAAIPGGLLGSITNTASASVANDLNPTNNLSSVVIPLFPMGNSPVLGTIGNQTIPEGSPATFTAAATDGDLPPQTLTFSLGVNAPAGASINPVTGSFTWTPTEAQGPGSYTFAVVVTDDGSPPLTDAQSVTITVTEVNEAPVISAPPTITVVEGSIASFTATTIDGDLPANNLLYSVTGPTGGTGATGSSMNPTNGVFTWNTTELDGPGIYTAIVTVSDNASPPLSDSTSVNIHVLESNQSPVFTPVSPTNVIEHIPFSMLVQASDGDVPVQTVSYSIDPATPAPAGLLLNPSSGLILWTPEETHGGASFTFNVIASDGTAATSQAITIHVLEVNEAPDLTPVSTFITTEQALFSTTLMASDTDLPAQALTFSLGPNAPVGLSLNAASGLISWTPTDSQGPATYTFDVTVTDSGAPPLSDTLSVTIQVIESNDAPVFGPIPPLNATEFLPFTYTPTATDADVPAQTLTFSLDPAAPPGLTINPSNGQINWTPQEPDGGQIFTFDLIVSDPLGQSDQQPISITVSEVNQAPTLSATGTSTVEQVSISIPLTGADSDLPVQRLIYTPGANAPAGVTINTASSSMGVLSWTPSEAQGPGSFTFDVVVTDDGAPPLSVTQSITIVVTEDNRPPTISAPATIQVVEGNPAMFAALATDPDLPGNGLQFNLAPGAPTGASLDFNTGEFLWNTSEFDGPGSYTVTVSVVDNASPAGSDSASVVIDVLETNDSPSLVSMTPTSATENVAFTLTPVATDRDVPVQRLTYSMGPNAPAGLSIDSATGQLDWTPSETQGGMTFSFDLVVTDAAGASDVEPISITVEEDAQLPLLNPVGNLTVAEGQPLMVPLGATDPDVPDTLTYSLGPNVPAGLVIDQNTGDITWTPSEAQGPASYIFNAQVRDSTSLSDSQSVTIIVTEVDSPPVLEAIPAITVTEGQPLSATALATDADLPAQSLTFSFDTGSNPPAPPAGLSIDSTTGEVTWTPTEAQGPGSYTIDIVVTDDSDLTDTTSLTITVLEENRAPIFSSIAPVAVVEGQPVDLTLTATDLDRPTQTLRYSLGPDAPVGLTLDSTTGEVSWTPTEGQGPGSFTFDVRVEDDAGASDTTSVTIQVTETNRPPALMSIPPAMANEGQALSLAITASDPDQPAQALTFGLGPDTPTGLTLDPTTGELSWTPTEGQGPGRFTFDVRVEDDAGASDTTSVTIEVRESNQPPVFNPIEMAVVLEEAPLTLTVAATDPDLPSQALTYALASDAPSGLDITSSSGELLWTPTEAQGPGLFTFDVIVMDDFAPAGSATTEVVVVVQETNRPPVLPTLEPLAAIEGETISNTVTATDADVPIQSLTYSVGPAAPAGLVIDAASGDITWTPTEADGGAVFVFDVIVTDDAGASDSEPLTILVADANTIPAIIPIDPVTAPEDVPLTLTVRVTDPDVPSQSISFDLGPNAPDGLTIDDSGVINWTPTEAQGPGVYTFEVIVTDPDATVRQPITITVTDENRPPQFGIVPDLYWIEGESNAVQLAASDADLPPQQLLFSLDGSGGTPPPGVTLSPEGLLEWQPGALQIGTNVFTIVVEDPDGEKDTREITIRVAPIPVILSQSHDRANARMNLTWPSLPDYQYQLECSPALDAANWEAVGTTTATRGTTQLPHAVTAESLMFYRVRILRKP